MNIFSKEHIQSAIRKFSEKYSYQSEARIYIHNSNPQDYLCFNIGSIEDIAILKKIRL